MTIPRIGFARGFILASKLRESAESGKLDPEMQQALLALSKFLTENPMPGYLEVEVENDIFVASPEPTGTAKVGLRKWLSPWQRND